MNTSRLTGAICAAALLVLSNTSHAALVTSILGLDIGGTLYDVTFHTNPGETFAALWDADNDGVWGGGTSVLTEAPLFWGNYAGAILASSAITAALGSADWVSASATANFDRILVPYTASTCPPATITAYLALTNSVDCIGSRGDSNVSPATDGQSDYLWRETVDSRDLRYASFTLSAIPVPAAVWLFGGGLLGLIGVARREARA